ncbi:MAG TPA: helix-turn-helix domain-containing protein [Nocardioides sp.]|nr:helix-turn-helix domain-containing protein [Nocardioides sp.]
MAESWTSVRLTPDALKVLAHPLRSRLLTALRGGGPATATTLAGHLATNTGATSYHLRRLAAVGLVEEVPGGRGRERWWQATTELHSWDDDAAGDDPDAREAAGWLRAHHLRHFVELAEDWLGHHEGWPQDWRRLAGSSDYLLEMTPAQLEDLMSDLWAVVDRHHGSAVAANAGLGDLDDLPADQRPHRVVLYLYDFPVGEYPAEEES